MRALASRYAALVCDLDGVVYRGPSAVPYAVETLAATGVPVMFATNNASRTPEEVSAHLRELGLACASDQVVTSSQAAAWLLRDRVADGARVLAVGGPGVRAALRAQGFQVVLPSDAAGAAPAAVVQGYGPAVTAADLAAAAYAVQDGAVWVATNADATLPTDRGVAPGNGSLVAAVARAVGRGPDLVAGKPHAPLYLLAAERLGLDGTQVLAVGDRLDTDIEGARRAGADSVLVLTGVDDLEAVLAAPVRQRPTYLAPDLRWLLDDPDTGRPSLARVAAAVADVHRAADGGAPESEVDALAALARGLLSAMAPR